MVQPATPAAGDAAVARLVAAMRFEVLPLGSGDDVIAALPPGSAVSVTCSPRRGIDATLAMAERLRATGHRPIPHLAARMVDGRAMVSAIAERLRQAAIADVFIVGGDAPRPHGPYHDATGFITDLLAAAPELATVGITAYPDGHPAIDDATLDAALDTKAVLLAQAGVGAYAVTQMCFDPARIHQWLTERRHRGLTLPIHLGIAGAVDPARLVRTGTRLGVGASLRFLSKNTGAVTRLLRGRHDPGHDLATLGPVLDHLGVEGLHCFTFNQVSATVEWQHAFLSRR